MTGAAHPRTKTTRGVVAAFDAVAGLGEVRADDGIELRFHCTQIADGSRDIPVGARVRFAVVAGRGGRWEAAALTPEGT